MTSKNTLGHSAGHSGSVESWLVSAGRDRRPGSPLNLPPCPASNFVLGDRRAYSRDDGTPSWESLEEIVGGLEGGSSVSFASGMAGIAAIFDQLPAGSVVALSDDCYQAVVGLAKAGQSRGTWTVHRIAGADRGRGRLDLAGVCFDPPANCRWPGHHLRCTAKAWCDFRCGQHLCYAAKSAS